MASEHPDPGYRDTGAEGSCGAKSTDAGNPGSEISRIDVLRPPPAIMARIMLVEKNATARSAVARVRIFPAARPDTKPEPPPPIPRAPPSDRCSKMTPTRAKAINRWMTSTTVIIVFRNLLESRPQAPSLHQGRQDTLRYSLNRQTAVLMPPASRHQRKFRFSTFYPLAAVAIAQKSSRIKLAPPTRTPSTSPRPSISAAFDGFTEPP